LENRAKIASRAGNSHALITGDPPIRNILTPITMAFILDIAKTSRPESGGLFFGSLLARHASPFGA